MFFAQDVNSMKAFVLDQYYCDARYSYGNNRIGTKGIFELPFTTNTAYEQYNNILSLLREEMSLPSDFEFEEAFEKLGFEYFSDGANFVMVKVENAPDVFVQMQKRGVIVRPNVGYGLPDWLRITIDTPEGNARCIEELSKFAK